MRLVPTSRAAALLALGLLPAMAASVHPAFGALALGLDLGVLALALIDALRAPRAAALELSREVETIVSAGAPNAVRLRIGNLRDAAVRLELADDPPIEAAVDRRRFALELPPLGRAERSYTVRPARRGDLAFGDLHVRTFGPWGLGARQERVAAGRPVKAYPDLQALAHDALALSRAQEESALLRARRALGEGREFEALRPYTRGDDYRAIDWKASARRGGLVARSYEPERNQTVVLVLDAGRQMTARIGERTRLDLTIDAALRLARVCLHRGDQVGLFAVGARLLASVPPDKGRAQLHRIVDALYRLQPALEETAPGVAFDALQARVKRRALVVVFTELSDEDSSRELLARVARLRPRHLPLVIACEDGELSAAATGIPADAEAAYARAAALRVLRDRDATRRRLLGLGARVASVPAEAISAAAINEYLDIKGRGLL